MGIPCFSDIRCLLQLTLTRRCVLMNRGNVQTSSGYSLCKMSRRIKRNVEIIHIVGNTCTRTIRIRKSRIIMSRTRRDFSPEIRCDTFRWTYAFWTVKRSSIRYARMWCDDNNSAPSQRQPVERMFSKTICCRSNYVGRAYTCGRHNGHRIRYDRVCNFLFTRPVGRNAIRRLIIRHS